MKSKKASEQLVSTKLIVLILVVLVIVVVLVFAFRSNILSWIKNLPGFAEPEDKEIDLSTLTPDELAKLGFVCSQGDEKVFILDFKPAGNALTQTFTDDYRSLYLFNPDGKSLVKTNLVMNVQDESNYILASSEIIGRVELGKVNKRVLTINSEVFKAFEKNDNFYISKEAEKIRKVISPDLAEKLDLSYSVAGKLFCQRGSEKKFKDNEKKCSILTCNLFEGQCKSQGETNEVSIGKLDCSDKECFVQETAEKLTDEQLKITEFRLNNQEFLGDSLNILFSEEYRFGYGTNYAPDLKPYCYFFITNKEIVQKGIMTQKEDFKLLNNYFVLWKLSNERLFGIIVFDPWNNLKVYKIIKIASSPLAKEIVITNENFKETIAKLEEGKEALALNMNFKLAESGGRSVFIQGLKIKKIKGEYFISAYYEPKPIATGMGYNPQLGWYELDCKKWRWGRGISLNSFRDTLKITVSQLCEYEN